MVREKLTIIFINSFFFTFFIFRSYILFSSCVLFLLPFLLPPSFSSLSPPSILPSTGAVAVSSDGFIRKRKLIHKSDVCCTGWEWGIKECASFDHSREDGEILLMNEELKVAAVRCVGNCPPHSPTLPVEPSTVASPTNSTAPTHSPTLPIEPSSVASPTNSTAPTNSNSSTPDCSWPYIRGEALVPLNYSKCVLILCIMWEI